MKMNGNGELDKYAMSLPNSVYSSPNKDSMKRGDEIFASNELDYMDSLFTSKMSTSAAKDTKDFRFTSRDTQGLAIKSD